jgi:hypothetical protein
MLRSYNASYLFGKEILQYRRIDFFFFMNLVHYLCLPPDSVSDINIIHISKPTSWQYLRTLWQEKIFWHCTVCILSRYRDRAPLHKVTHRYWFWDISFLLSYLQLILVRLVLIQLSLSLSLSLCLQSDRFRSLLPTPSKSLSPFSVIRFIEFFSV